MDIDFSHLKEERKLTEIMSKADRELFDTLRIMEEIENGTFEQKFEEIIDLLKSTNLKDNKIWMLPYSSGKDSSLVLHFVLQKHMVEVTKNRNIDFMFLFLF